MIIYHFCESFTRSSIALSLEPPPSSSLAVAPDEGEIPPAPVAADSPPTPLEFPDAAALFCRPGGGMHFWSLFRRGFDNSGGEDDEDALRLELCGGDAGDVAEGREDNG